MKRTSLLISIFIVTTLTLKAQVFSTPGGVVFNNGSTDQVLVNGNTKLINPNGRTLTIERDDEDSWLMFHDPNEYWFSMGIDRSNSGAFTLNTGGTLGAATQFIMTSTGNVGIGTSSPVNILDVNGVGRFRRNGSPTSGLTIGGDALSLKGWGAQNPYIEWINSDDSRLGYFGWNTSRLSLVLENGNNFTIENGNVGIGTTAPDGLLEVKGPYSGNSQLTINSTSSNAELRFSDNGVPKGFVWYYKASDLMAFGRGSTSNSILVNPAGNVGIGSLDPTEKLTVNGTIYGKEVKVDLSVPGPDYVFDNQYDLSTLGEVEAYINTHKHLPDVPSAKEMGTDGINVGAMNMILLKKIEELTLYVIELKKRINDRMK